MTQCLTHTPDTVWFDPGWSSIDPSKFDSNIFRLWIMTTLAPSPMTKSLTHTLDTAWFNRGWSIINPSRICMWIHTKQRMIPWKKIFINYDSVTQCLTQLGLIVGGPISTQPFHHLSDSDSFLSSPRSPNIYSELLTWVLTEIILNSANSLSPHIFAAQFTAHLNLTQAVTVAIAQLFDTNPALSSPQLPDC